VIFSFLFEFHVFKILIFKFTAFVTVAGNREHEDANLSQRDEFV
jgi:hypothetical protein